MKCPTCGRPAKDSDRECECGEQLTPWRTIEWYGHTLRQRGLVLAARQDYLGACVSFLEATLTNPLDDSSLVDASRALARLGRREEALRLLGEAAARSP